MTNLTLENKLFSDIDMSIDPILNRYDSSGRAEYIAALLSAWQNASAQTLVKVPFSSDIWDFSSMMEGTKFSQGAVYHFKRLPKDLKIKVKFFLMDALIRSEKKVSTLYIRFTTITSVLTSIMARGDGKALDEVCTRDIIDEIESRNLKAYAKHSAYLAIQQFYHYLIVHCHLAYPVDIDRLSSEQKHANEVSKKQDNKLANIPREYAKEIENRSVLIMRDKMASYPDRLVACAILMLMKLGVRIGDLLDFKANCLKSTVAKNEGYEYYSITYYIHKISRLNCEDYGHEIYSPQLCTEAFKTMLQIRTTQAGSSSGDFLFCKGESERLTKAVFNNLYRGYMHEHFSDLCLSSKWADVFKPCSHKGATLYFPETRQYRVFLCNELLAKGVSWAFIEEHLKHLSDTMAGYYARPEDKTEEYIGYAENVLKTIVIDNISPLGCQGEEIKKNIDAFLAQNKVNVGADCSAIYGMLKQKVAIRAKTGGFCFKTSLVPCSQEAGTNKMLCAFDLCPNIYSFYYMMDISYLEFKGHIEAYEQNTMKGLTRGAAKELAAVKGLIFRKLQPQLNQLEKELETKGYDAVVDEHPNMIDIIKEIPKIKKEIKEWKTM